MYRRGSIDTVWCIDDVQYDAAVIPLRSDECCYSECSHSWQALMLQAHP